MNIIKYLLIFLLTIALSITFWLYYPQYKIEKLKQPTIEASNDKTNVSYLDYFRNSQANEINHLAIGDSIIRGVGAKQGENFVNHFSSHLQQQTNKKLKLENKGINGITSGELNALVQKGTFDSEMKKSDIITINVGGNDILRIAKKQNFKSALKSFDQLQSTFSSNLSDILTKIKQVNPDATIVFLELYNPLKPSDQVYPIADQLLPNWNLEIYKIAEQYPSSLVVETTKVMNGKKTEYLSADGVHPNSAGYTAISKLMIYQFEHQYRKKVL